MQSKIMLRGMLTRESVTGKRTATVRG
jgi:hypothetical protein